MKFIDEIKNIEKNDLNIKIDIKKDNIDIIFTLLYSDTFNLNNDEFLIHPKETYAQTLYNKDVNEVVEKVFNKNFKESNKYFTKIMNLSSKESSDYKFAKSRLINV